jgi:hypothetical protein
MRFTVTPEQLARAAAAPVLGPAFRPLCDWRWPELQTGKPEAAAECSAPAEAPDAPPVGNGAEEAPAPRAKLRRHRAQPQAAAAVTDRDRAVLDAAPDCDRGVPEPRSPPRRTARLGLFVRPSHPRLIDRTGEILRAVGAVIRDGLSWLDGWPCLAPADSPSAGVMLASAR